MTGVLFKRGNLGMQAHTGRLSYEDEDRNWGDASTGQGVPKVSGMEPILSHSFLKASILLAP